MADVILPEGWPRPKGYANGMAASGRFVAVGGQVGWNAEGRMVSKDFVAQFVQALDNVITIVKAAGGRGSDIVSMTVYVIDKLQYIGSTTEIGQAWRERLDRHFPAMALLEVSGLLEPDALVEIQALAVISDARGGVAP